MTTKAPTSGYYTFYQNNSGGFYKGPSLVSVYADSLDEALTLATDHGVYLDWRDDDCECCGERWDDSPEFCPDAPKIFGEPIADSWAACGGTLAVDENGDATTTEPRTR